MASQNTPDQSTRKYSLHMAVNMGICQVELVHGQIEDRILWLRTNDSEYSANSFYNLVVTAGKTKWEYRFIWQLKIPHTVRVFAFLLLQGRLLTYDVMNYRGIQCDLQMLPGNRPTRVLSGLVWRSTI